MLKNGTKVIKKHHRAQDNQSSAFKKKSGSNILFLTSLLGIGHSDFYIKIQIKFGKKRNAFNIFLYLCTNFLQRVSQTPIFKQFKKSNI